MVDRYAGTRTTLTRRHGQEIICTSQAQCVISHQTPQIGNTSLLWSLFSPISFAERSGWRMVDIHTERLSWAIRIVSLEYVVNGLFGSFHIVSVIKTWNMKCATLRDNYTPLSQVQVTCRHWALCKTRILIKMPADCNLSSFINGTFRGSKAPPDESLGPQLPNHQLPIGVHQEPHTFIRYMQTRPFRKISSPLGQSEVSSMSSRV
jgi:hypothetical protein